MNFLKSDSELPQDIVLNDKKKKKTLENDRLKNIKF